MLQRDIKRIPELARLDGQIIYWELCKRLKFCNNDKGTNQNLSKKLKRIRVYSTLRHKLITK